MFGFNEMKSDGRSLDDKRIELFTKDGNRDFGDLHSIITEFKKKKKNTDRGKQHFSIPKQEIIDNDYDLSLSKYKEEIYAAEHYDEPIKIFDNIENIETNILQTLKELKAIIPQ